MKRERGWARKLFLTEESPTAIGAVVPFSHLINQCINQSTFSEQLNPTTKLYLCFCLCLSEKRETGRQSEWVVFSVPNV